MVDNLLTDKTYVTSIWDSKNIEDLLGPVNLLLRTVTLFFILPFHFCLSSYIKTLHREAILLLTGYHQTGNSFPSLRFNFYPIPHHFESGFSSSFIFPDVVIHSNKNRLILSIVSTSVLILVSNRYTIVLP